MTHLHRTSSSMSPCAKPIYRWGCAQHVVNDTESMCWVRHVCAGSLGRHWACVQRCLEWLDVMSWMTWSHSRVDSSLQPYHVCVWKRVLCLCRREREEWKREEKKRGLAAPTRVQTWTKRDYCICYPSRSLQNGIFKCHHCYLIISNMEHCVIVSVEKCIFLGLSWWSLSSNTKVARNSHLPPSWKPWLVTCRCSREREVRIPRISSVSSHRPRTKIVPPVKNKNLHGGQA